MSKNKVSKSLLETHSVEMASKKSGGKNTLKQEQVYQAVVIADSFNRRFEPLTLNQPRVRFNDIIIV